MNFAVHKRLNIILTQLLIDKQVQFKKMKDFVYTLLNILIVKVYSCNNKYYIVE